MQSKALLSDALNYGSGIIIHTTELFIKVGTREVTTLL